MIVWKMMSKLATTAQNTPAGWLGTVLPLQTEQNKIKIGERARGNLRNVIAVNHGSIVRRYSALVSFESVHGLDICDHDEYCAREDEDERDQAESADAVQAHKVDCDSIKSRQ